MQNGVKRNQYGKYILHSNSPPTAITKSVHLQPLQQKIDGSIILFLGSFADDLTDEYFNRTDE